MHLRRPAAVLAALALLVPLAACGDGEPAPDPSPGPTAAFDPTELDLDRIDPTHTDLSAAASPELARRAAAYELGEHLVLPQEVDAALTRTNIDSGAAVTPEDFDFLLEGDTVPLESGTARSSRASPTRTSTTGSPPASWPSPTRPPRRPPPSVHARATRPG